MQKMFVLPTAETVNYMDVLFQGAPILIDPSTFGVEIGSSKTAVAEPDPTKVYRAIPGLMNAWYDTAEARSYWILPLIPSPEMTNLHKTIGDAWGRMFVPFIRIAEVQNMRRHNAAWMRSVASGLASTRPILTFHNAFVTNDSSVYPAHQDFYQDYLARGGLDNNVFLETTDR